MQFRLKIGLSVVLTAFLLFNSALASTVAWNTTQINKNQITLSGTLIDDNNTGIANEMVTLTVFESEDETNLNLINYVMQNVTSKKGKFSFQYLMDDDMETGMYSAYISSKTVTDNLNKSFYYASFNGKVEAIGAFKFANTFSAVKEFFENENYAITLGLSKVGFYALLEDEYVTRLYELIATSEIKGGCGDDEAAEATISEIQGVYAEILKKVYSEQIYKNIIMRFKNCTNAQCVSLIVNNNDIISIDEARISSLNENVAGNVIGRISEISNMEDLKQVVTEEVVIALVNNVARANAEIEIPEIIEANYDVFQISLDEYTNDDKKKIYLELSANEYETISEIRKAVKSAAASSPTSPSKSGGSSRGNSGSYVAEYNIINTVVEESNSAMFDDLKNVSWAVESIEYLANKMILNGTGNGMFDPERAVTREEFVKMLMSALNITETGAKVDFDDVSISDWFYTYIASAINRGIVKGTSDTHFGVGSNISRQDMAVLCERALKVKNISFVNKTSKAFTDYETIADYAKSSVETMRSMGIINGMENNNYEPYANATRAQAAKIVYEVLKLLE